MQRSTSATLTVTAWMIVAVGLCGCRQTRQPPAHPTGALRIVSMSPAISRTLVDFGVEDKIVGRSAWCASLDPAIPVAGDLYDVDYERLIRLDPTHVLVQPPSTGLDPTLQRLATERGWIIGRWKFDTLDDVEQMVREKQFREDLFFRLNVLRLDLPPLRDRGDDILLLSRRLLASASAHAGRQLRFGADVETALRAFAWPGNVRQLQNEMQRIVALAEGPEIGIADLSPAVAAAAP